MSDPSDRQGWWLAADGTWRPPRPATPGPGTPEAWAVTASSPTIPGTAPAWAPAPGAGPRPTPGLDDFAQAPAPRPAPSRRRGLVLGAGAAVAVVVVVVLVLMTVLAPGGRSPGWHDGTLHVVGTPVAADGVVVALTVAHRALELTAVRPADGAVLWTKPFSASGVTPGVGFGPVAVDGTVLDLAPASDASDPSVVLQGLDAATGAVEWSVPQFAVLPDAPEACPGGRLFCVPLFTNDTTTALVALDPATGRVVGSVAGPLRAISSSPSGGAGGLWQSDDTTPTLMQVSGTGTTLWRRSVASLLGPGYDPDDGWYVLTAHGLDVGSIGADTSGPLDGLGASATVALSVRTGDLSWRTPGAYDCYGTLAFLRAPVLCRFSGTVPPLGTPGTLPKLTGLHLTLRGLDAATGRPTWSLAVNDGAALLATTNIAFLDATHVVVQRTDGARVVLDTATGTTAPAATGEVFWCERVPSYRVATAQGASVAGERTSSPVFSGCSAGGRATSAVPVTGSSLVGVEAGGTFVWPSPTGLHGTHQG